MKKYLFLALLIMGGLLWLQTARLRSEKRERRRLKSNQTALMSDVEIYRTKAGKAAASNMVLNLRVSELERLRAADAESIRDLGIKLKRVESTAKTATATVVNCGQNSGTQPSSGRPRPGRSLWTRCGHFAGAMRG